MLKFFAQIFSFLLTCIARRGRQGVLVLICLSLAAGGSAHAKTLTWNGGGGAGNTSWGVSVNWGVVGIPASGDTLIFSNAVSPVNTNNLTGLVLNQIIFQGATGGFDIRGNAFTVTNSIIVTNTAGANTIENDLGLDTSDVLIVVSNGVSLTLDGAISGSVGVNKTGLGTLTYQGSGNNTYTGTTLVTDGTLELNVGGANSFSGPLVIGDGISIPTVKLLQSTEIDNASPITINKNGTLNLNNFDDTIGTNLVLSDGVISTGTGTLTLSPNCTILITNNSSNQINGHLNTGSGTLTIQGNGALVDFGGLGMNAVVSGSADIVQNDCYCYWEGANTFTGNLTANGTGQLLLYHSLALGSTNNSLTLNGQTSVQPVGINITNRSVTINSTYSLGALYISSVGSANYWQATNFTLGAACTVGVATRSTLNLNGPITGPGSLTKVGPGTLTLSGSASDPYVGQTFVNDGTLNLSKTGGAYSIGYGALTIGDGFDTAGTAVVREFGNNQIDNVSVTINSDGLLDLNGNSDSIGTAVTLNGGANIQNTGAGTLSLANGTTLGVYSGTSSISGNINVGTTTCLWTNTGDLTMNASVSGSASITKAGAGNVYLTASNSYTGLMTVNSGFLWCSNTWALGTTNGGTVVNGSASLVLAGSIGVTNEALTLNGAGTNNWGALDVHTGTNIWAGPVTLNTNSTFNAADSSSVLRINGAISGSGGVELDGSGTYYYDGSTANTYAGVTTVFYDATLILNKTIAFGAIAIPNNLYIYGIARAAANFQITNSADVYIDLGGLFDCGTYLEQIDTLRGPGSLTFGVNGEIEVGLNNGSSTFDGVMSGTGYALGGPTVAKKGSGTFTMNGDNTFTAGSTYIYSPGKLVINGSQPQSPVLVNSGATLAGSGTVGNLMANGNISPGNSPGILTCSNLTCTMSGTYDVDLTGTTAGTGYDQLNVRGTNTLANSMIVLSPSFSTPVAVGQQFTIIKNDGVGPIIGTYNSLPDGATITSGGFQFRINYNSGDGNDVVLTLVGVPGAVASSAVIGGNGNHAIDVNECNNLNLALTNVTATPMTGVTATLYSTTLNVMVTQPESAYPDVPATGKSTNTTAFQISTLPGFVCGTDINLVLAVTTTSHGAFSMPVVLHTGEPAISGPRYDAIGSSAIPDGGSVDSINTVSGFTGPLAKVVVAMWVTFPFDSDLAVSLISPDGTTVPLVSGTGAGGDFGTNCSPDTARTTFDDFAPASISLASSPFVGTFQPQGSLATFSYGATNGNWRLHIFNDHGHPGAVGTLNCWSLILYPATCSSGGGVCGTCPPAIDGSITGGDPVATGRVTKNSIVSSGVTSKTYPGTTPGAYHYDIYNFTNNTGADACISVGLVSPYDVESCAYFPAFNPLNVALNYAGDAGDSTGTAGGSTSFAFNVPAGSNFLVTVTEITGGAGAPNYTLMVNGLECPPPSLHIQSVATNQARLFWPSSAGGYSLKSKTNLASGSWNAVTNEPIINSGSYNVTNNSIVPASRFYLLEKP